ncbi:MAG: hypothetical protein CM1200mP1_06940 [Candidatus Neomarinimicrobiota bacterium]|nr:MAG: hypothetical protein CM1200mP1_06940 [Candidatus Neomarinimicrobiota bacterium]
MGYKSIDGGKTGEILKVSAKPANSSSLINPKNPDVVYIGLKAQLGEIVKIAVL